VVVAAMPATASSAVIRGRARQVRVMWQNSRECQKDCAGVIDRNVSAGHRGWPEPGGGQDDDARGTAG
jgi:hypothetical protein